MKTPCGIIKDLLPLYSDNVCAPESRALVEEHIKECQICEEALQAISDELVRPVYNFDEPKPAQATQEVREKDKSLPNIIIIAALIISAILACVYLFYYPRPLKESPDVISSQKQITDTERDTIAPYILRDGEYWLARILTWGTTSHIFNFNASKEYKTLSLRCDEYRNGELLRTFGERKFKLTDSDGTWGMIAIMHQDKTMGIRILAGTMGSGLWVELENMPDQSDNGISWSDSFGMAKTAEIEDNKEIPLYVYASDANSSAIHTPEQYIDNPEIISQYDYFCIVTCVFSTDEWRDVSDEYFRPMEHIP